MPTREETLINWLDGGGINGGLYIDCDNMDFIIDCVNELYVTDRRELVRNKANARINRKTRLVVTKCLRLGLHPIMQLKRLQPIQQTLVFGVSD